MADRAKIVVMSDRKPQQPPDLGTFVLRHARRRAMRPSRLQRGFECARVRALLSAPRR